VDVALYCNGANAIFTVLPRLFGMPVALNVDGLERKRKKWNRAAKAWYLVSEWLATFLPNAVVTDARAIQDYYRERYGKRTRSFRMARRPARWNPPRPSELGLEPGRYFLYVSRMEPENHALEVRQAFERVRTDMKLALIGDAPYARDYIRQVRDTRDPRIVIPGAILWAGYHELDSHCFAYIHATEVGGTHPALIEAMGRGALVLYRDNPPRTPKWPATPAFRSATIWRRKSNRRWRCPNERTVKRAPARARTRARHYCWDAVATAYQNLFQSIMK
jgi:glycosyltransferase involved in cell wall biosynthesis